jgi:hypothetical protein
MYRYTMKSSTDSTTLSSVIAGSPGSWETQKTVATITTTFVRLSQADSFIIMALKFKYEGLEKFSLAYTDSKNTYKVRYFK